MGLQENFELQCQCPVDELMSTGDYASYLRTKVLDGKLKLAKEALARNGHSHLNQLFWIVLSINSLNQRYRNAMQRQTKDTRLISNLLDRIEELKEDIEELRQESNALKKDVAERDEELEAQEDEIAALNRKITSLKQVPVREMSEPRPAEGSYARLMKSRRF